MTLRMALVVQAFGLLMVAAGSFLIGSAVTSAVRAFDDYQAYTRQGYHQCDSPSGWCENEKETNPCGK